MSEALRKPSTAPVPVPQFREPLRGLMPAVVPSEVNDNQPCEPSLRTSEKRGFEIPESIWVTMIACYGVFLAALLGATGGAYATMMIAISVVYVTMFFGTARVLLRQFPPQARSPLDRAGGVLQTIYGPLSGREVVAQMLVVPAAVAFFGVAVLIIRVVGA